jgi:hypothetical protein
VTSASPKIRMDEIWSLVPAGTSVVVPEREQKYRPPKFLSS